MPWSVSSRGQAAAWRRCSCPSKTPSAVAGCLADVAGRFGRIHSVVYAAGPVTPINFVGSITTDEWTRTFALDTHGCFHLARAALPILKQQKGGSLTAVTTTQFSRHVPMSVLSSAPKAAIESMLQVAAREYGRYGVRANAVRSGWLDGGKFADGIGGQVSDKAKQAIVASIPLGIARRSGRRGQRGRVSVVSRGALRHWRGTVGRRGLEAVSTAPATIEPFRVAIAGHSARRSAGTAAAGTLARCRARGWLDPGCAARVSARAGRPLERAL